MDWSLVAATGAIVVGLLVGTVPLHSSQLVEHERCQIQIYSGGGDDTDTVPYESLTTREQQAVEHAIQSGSHRFACPSDSTLVYAGDVSYSSTIVHNDTPYTVTTSYNDVLLPMTELKQAASVILGAAFVGAGLFSIVTNIRD